MPQLSTVQKILILVVVLLLVVVLGLWVAHVGPFGEGESEATSTTNTSTTTVSNVNLVPVTAVPDADRDGVSDADESTLGTNLNVADSDADGLSDFQEAKVYHTDPLQSDTDGDGAKDGAEVGQQTNPRGTGPLYNTSDAINELTNATNP